MTTFTASFDWYWISKDSRVYDSGRNAIVDATDTGYRQFLLFNVPAPWPNDSAGNQTNASLLAVLPPGTPPIVDLRMKHA